MGATDAVKDNVHALPREAANLLHEIELAVVIFGVPAKRSVPAGELWPMALPPRYKGAG